MPTPIAVGQPAPDFRLKGPGGQFVTLSEHFGRKNVVLVFYPLAFSPACSHQLPTVQRDLERFESLGAVVYGISVDSHYANEAFARSLGISFDLLSDFRRQASAAYGVLLDEAGTSGRAMVVVDKQGRVAWCELSSNAGDLDLIPSNESALRALEALRAPTA
jgi:peroxiredoxin